MMIRAVTDNEEIGQVTQEYIRYRLVEHTPAELLSAYQQAEPHLRAAPECLAYALTACEEDPTVLILCIEWTSTEGHLQGFRKGPHFPPFLNAIRPFISEIEEMRHYAPTPLSWQR
jgi:quinol monooxygenase YgiN